MTQVGPQKILSKKIIGLLFKKLKCMNFGKLILRKITKIAAVRYILKVKCTKFNFGRGSAPDPPGELTVLLRPPSWI